jgi:PAS domain-containing protein
VWKPKGRSNAEPGLWAQDHKTVKSVMESASNQNVSIGEPMYRRIVEAVPEGIWVVDAQGLTIFSNRRMAEILGIDELIPAQSCFAWVFSGRVGRCTASICPKPRWRSPAIRISATPR